MFSRKRKFGVPEKEKPKTKPHKNVCQYHDSFICSLCARHCDKCKSTMCFECSEMGFEDKTLGWGEHCPHCNDSILYCCHKSIEGRSYGCHPSCDKHKIICPSNPDLYKCKGCGRFFCYSCRQKCHICKDLVPGMGEDPRCLECVRRCEVCGNITCSSDMTRHGTRSFDANYTDSDFEYEFEWEMEREDPPELICKNCVKPDCGTH